MEKHIEQSDPNSCLSKAQPDEPIFVLRANDPDAPTLVRMWIHLREMQGSTRLEKLAEARRCADAMEKWRSAHYVQTITPTEADVLNQGLAKDLEHAEALISRHDTSEP